MTIDFFPHRENPIDLGLLRTMIWNAYTQVSLIIEHGGDGKLPPGQDPYTFITYDSAKDDGAYVVIRSPTCGPTLGYKLTWGNIKQLLIGILDFMVQGRRSYSVNFIVSLDVVGHIGWGALLEGEPPERSNLIGRVGDVESSIS